MTTGTPPGWYPDPERPGAVRWWDGTMWTEHVSGPAAGPAEIRLDEEEATAGRAMIALAVAIPLQFVAWLGTRAWLADIVDRWDELTSSDSNSAFSGGDSGALLLQQFGQFSLLAVGVFFLLWFYRAAVNALALGLPARREPNLGVAGFIIPIVNLWWPYQSTRDLLPPGHPARAHVLQWFLLWVVGNLVSVCLVVASAFVEGPVVYLLLVIPVAQVTLAAVAARRVISDVLESHQQLAAARNN